MPPVLDGTQDKSNPKNCISILETELTTLCMSILGNELLSAKNSLVKFASFIALNTISCIEFDDMSTLVKVPVRSIIDLINSCGSLRIYVKGLYITSTMPIRRIIWIINGTRLASGLYLSRLYNFACSSAIASLSP